MLSTVVRRALKGTWNRARRSCKTPDTKMKNKKEKNSHEYSLFPWRAPFQGDCALQNHEHLYARDGQYITEEKPECEQGADTTLDYE